MKRKKTKPQLRRRLPPPAWMTVPVVMPQDADQRRDPRVEGISAPAHVSASDELKRQLGEVMSQTIIVRNQLEVTCHRFFGSVPAVAGECGQNPTRPDGVIHELANMLDEIRASLNWAMELSAKINRDL